MANSGCIDKQMPYKMMVFKVPFCIHNGTNCVQDASRKKRNDTFFARIMKKCWQEKNYQPSHGNIKSNTYFVVLYFGKGFVKDAKYNN